MTIIFQNCNRNGAFCASNSNSCNGDDFDLQAALSSQAATTASQTEAAPPEASSNENELGLKPTIKIVAADPTDNHLYLKDVTNQQIEIPTNNIEQIELSPSVENIPPNATVKWIQLAPEIKKGIYNNIFINPNDLNQKTLTQILAVQDESNRIIAKAQFDIKLADCEPGTYVNPHIEQTSPDLQKISLKYDKVLLSTKNPVGAYINKHTKKIFHISIDSSVASGKCMAINCSKNESINSFLNYKLNQECQNTFYNAIKGKPYKTLYFKCINNRLHFVNMTGENCSVQ